MERTYICIDLKSYYASVECVYRGLDPLKANLLVADESRSDQTICLAVSPSLKAMGVPGRPRLFEAKQKIREYEALHHTKVEYIIAVPRMAEYERISAKIYSIYLRYVAKEDIHVYSIDECFIDVTGYLHAYRKDALTAGTNPAHFMAITMIRDVLKETGITATVGIGTNLYLAKVAMDIVAKKRPADKDGVRIAELNEDSYKFLLWDHRPLTDFWQIGHGKAGRLERNHMYTMGDIAERTQWNEEWFYKTFGIDAEILIDHAWGI
ncbi:MAG: DNA methylase, partial [Firmicutes bacterium]|nr:DNA methylase [Bacillota bacterium]